MIEILTGLPGGGKSFELTRRAIEGRKEGRRVLSNVPILGAYKLTKQDLIDSAFEPGDLLIIDEAGADFNSKDWQLIPDGAYILFSQHRHLCLDMVVAVQEAVRMAKPLRELAQVYWWCEPSLIGWYQRRKFPNGYVHKRFRPIYFVHTRYTRFEDIGKFKLDDGLPPKKVRRLFRPEIARAYDTENKDLINERKVREFPLWEVDMRNAPRVVQIGDRVRLMFKRRTIEQPGELQNDHKDERSQEPVSDIVRAG